MKCIFYDVYTSIVRKKATENPPRIDINQKMFSLLGLSYIGKNI